MNKFKQVVSDIDFAIKQNYGRIAEQVQTGDNLVFKQTLEMLVDKQQHLFQTITNSNELYKIYADSDFELYKRLTNLTQAALDDILYQTPDKRLNVRSKYCSCEAKRVYYLFLKSLVERVFGIK